MEYKKDNMSANENYKRQNNDNGQKRDNNSVSFNNSEERSQINKGLSFVFRKSEKLTTALYMVTDIMPEREPMKWKMRETSVELLSGVTSAMNVTPGEKMSALADVLKKIDRLISFLEIAHASRMLSAMNASVLKKEYTLLKTSVEYEWTKIFDQGNASLSESFFHVPEEKKLEAKNENTVDERKESRVRYAPMVEPKRHEQAEVEVREFSKTNIQSIAPRKETEREVTSAQRHSPMQVHPDRMHGVSIPKDAAKEIFNRSEVSDLLPERVRPEGDKSDRRTIILALIKQKPNLGVKDFVKSIPNVSEKTIQRELLAMVAEGTLTKKGERRWSTYSLPNQ